MTTKTTTTERRKMPADELRRELKAKRLVVSRMRLALELKKEKDSAAYRREKREVARMLTTMNETKSEPLPKKAASPKVSARSRSKS